VEKRYLQSISEYPINRSKGGYRHIVAWSFLDLKVCAARKSLSLLPLPTTTTKPVGSIVRPNLSLS
jgi:hypothetical protein